MNGKRWWLGLGLATALGGIAVPQAVLAHEPIFKAPENRYERHFDRRHRDQGYWRRGWDDRHRHGHERRFRHQQRHWDDRHRHRYPDRDIWIHFGYDFRL